MCNEKCNGENMRENTYIKIEKLYKKYKGYVGTKNLLAEGFSNRQIFTLVNEGYLQKVCYGHDGMNMEIKDRIKELRESTGMNRKEFCEYFGIPYRTVTEWERGTRKMPDYVFRLLAYKIKMENFAGKEEANEESDN